MYNPAYQGKLSTRTIWHNIIIGMSYSPTFSRTLGVTSVDDRQAIEAVLRVMRERNDPRLTQEWEVQKILNSLGSHNSFDWRTYEQVAKEIVLEQITSHPWAALRMMLWEKPLWAYNTITCQAMLLSSCNIDLDKVSRKTIAFRPWGIQFRGWALMPLLMLLPVPALLVLVFQTRRS